jgi:hypothetical protein
MQGTPGPSCGIPTTLSTLAALAAPSITSLVLFPPKTETPKGDPRLSRDLQGVLYGVRLLGYASAALGPPQSAQPEKFEHLILFVFLARARRN